MNNFAGFDVMLGLMRSREDRSARGSVKILREKKREHGVKIGNELSLTWYFSSSVGGGMHANFNKMIHKRRSLAPCYKPWTSKDTKKMPSCSCLHRQCSELSLLAIASTCRSVHTPSLLIFLPPCTLCFNEQSWKAVCEEV